MSSVLDNVPIGSTVAESARLASEDDNRRFSAREIKHPALVDRFQREHRSLRISVTDVCNIRCQYCMPADSVQFLPNHRHLTYAQIATVVRIASSMGIKKYRLTGGEPLVRPGLDQLVRDLNRIPGVQEIALTTNGMLLAEQLDSLASAGLQRINISLDTLSEEKFKQLSRRTGLNRVLEGIEAAIAEPRVRVRLNALILRDVNLDDVVTLVEFARVRKVVVRFIEFMPLDAQRAWDASRMVSGTELRRVLSQRFGPLTACKPLDPSQPATDYEFSDGSKVGFIDSVTRPFCGACDRLRLTSDGKLRNCLFGKQEWDIARLLASESDLDARVSALFRECVSAKAAAHGISEPNFQPPDRAMYQIGG